MNEFITKFWLVSLATILFSLCALAPTGQCDVIVKPWNNNNDGKPTIEEFDDPSTLQPPIPEDMDADALAKIGCSGGDPAITVKSDNDNCTATLTGISDITITGFTHIRIPRNANKALKEHELGHDELYKYEYDLMAKAKMEAAVRELLNTEIKVAGTWPDCKADLLKKIKDLRDSMLKSVLKSIKTQMEVLGEYYDHMTDYGKSQTCDTETGVRETKRIEQTLRGHASIVIKAIVNLLGSFFYYVIPDTSVPNAGSDQDQRSYYDNDTRQFSLSSYQPISYATDPADPIIDRGLISIAPMPKIGITENGMTWLTDTRVQIMDEVDSTVLLDGLLLDIMYIQSTIPDFAGLVQGCLAIPPEWAGGVNNTIGSEFLAGMADVNAPRVPLVCFFANDPLFDENGQSLMPPEGVTGDLRIGQSVPLTSSIRIEKTHNALQGHYANVSITTEDIPVEMGGFDFLIAYDASALAFMEATPGQLLKDCGWEYFTYRYGADGNCGDACPSGLLRIIAIAETDDGPNHPSCYGPPDPDPHELVEMNFLVTNDRTLECQYVPIKFFWGDCNDNSVSSVDGEVLYVSNHVYEFEGTDITDSTLSFPTYYGVQAGCLEGDKNVPVPLVNFVNGGIDIICSEDIDARGDINANGVKNEIADAVMFTNYFISGMSAFVDHVEASIAASDVNADGITLSVADLVYLVRVIQGDAQPYPKPIIGTQTASISTSINHSAMALSAKLPVDIGAGYFVFEYSGYDIGEPHLINGASDMTLKHSSENGVLKVLVYSLEKDIKIPAGAESIFAVPIDGEGSISLIEIQLSDYNGNTLEAKIETQPILPVNYSLLQNYPNPFNAATTIFYELPKASQVKLEIFNVLGQKVATLIDDEETAGIHSAVWDGTDESGTNVASGMYLYRITMSDFTSEKKMVMLK